MKCVLKLKCSHVLTCYNKSSTRSQCSNAPSVDSDAGLSTFSTSPTSPTSPTSTNAFAKLCTVVPWVSLPLPPPPPPPPPPSSLPGVAKWAREQREIEGCEYVKLLSEQVHVRASEAKHVPGLGVAKSCTGAFISSCRCCGWEQKALNKKNQKWTKTRSERVFNQCPCMNIRQQTTVVAYQCPCT